ncbi:MAG: hypothetical protein HZA54_11540 [Planctomycetes bacterium]|nr:hypothetical protein [Planctomycetota bacterium]
MIIRIRELRPELVLGLLVFACHAYFFNGGLDNQRSRYAPIFAFVEPGTPDTHSCRINRFLHGRAADRRMDTVDWALSRGEYYSNKAPGTTLLGIPPYLALHALEVAVDLDPTSVQTTVVNSYLLNLCISVFWTAVATVCLYRFLRDRFAAPSSPLAPAAAAARDAHRDALFIALIYAFGTLVFPFDTQLWGHPTAAAFLLLAFTRLFKPAAGAVFLAGFYAGMALMTEYPAGIALPAFGCALLLGGDRLRRSAWFAAGLLPPVAALMAYQWVCFGSPWTTATVASLSNPAFTDLTLRFGLFGAFSPQNFWDLLFSPHRGHILYMPVLLAAAAAVPRMRRERGRDYLAACLLTLGGNLVAISCFLCWHGGWTSGSRYLIFSLPFWCLLLPRFSALGPRARVAYALIALLALANMLAVAAVTPMAPESDPNPLYGSLIYGRFFRGEFPDQMNALRIEDPQTHEALLSNVFNWGWVLTGRPGLYSLLPYAALFALGVAAAWRPPVRRAPQPAPPSTP